MASDSAASTSDPDDDDEDDDPPAPVDVVDGDPTEAVAEPPLTSPVPQPPPEPPKGWQIRQRAIVRWNPDTCLVSVELPRFSAYSADITGPLAAG
jgi:hypothetical protein